MNGLNGIFKSVINSLFNWLDIFSELCSSVFGCMVIDKFEHFLVVLLGKLRQRILSPNLRSAWVS